MKRNRLYFALAGAFGLLALALYLAAPKFNPNENSTRELYVFAAMGSAAAGAGFAIGAFVRRSKGLS